MSPIMLIAGRVGTEPVVLTNGLTAHIVASEDSAHIAVVSLLDPCVHTELGRITSESFGVRLEARERVLRVLPGQAHVHSASSTNFEPHSVEYELREERDGRVEILILRHGDMITSPPSLGNLACTWTTSNLQVESSATTKPSDSKTDIPDTPEEEEEETDDEPENSEQPFTAVPVTQPKSQPTATPRLSHQLSVVVHETPTAVRTAAPSDFQEERNSSGSSGNPPPQMETEDIAFSTARIGHSPHENGELDEANLIKSDDASEHVPNYKRKGSPEVIVNSDASKKRPQPGSDTAELDTDTEQAQTNKRARRSMSSDNNVQTHGQADTPVDMSGRKRSSRGKKQLSETFDDSPVRVTRNSSQNSTMAAAEAYEGPPPHVAFSNSAIEKTSPTMRFLKRNTGSVAEAIDKECNVLCTRDGTLAKTTKIVQAIARGIPIVTDKWLQDSAGAGRFLELSSYKPSFPEQEEEWKFDFAKVWNQPQTIFEGYTIYFTHNFKDKSQYGSVCKAAGAKVTNSKKQIQNDNTIVIAKEEDDPEAEKLIQDSVTCYTKDLLTTSILRGNVELDSNEFKIGEGAEAIEARMETRKKKARKST